MLTTAKIRSLIDRLEKHCDDVQKMIAVLRRVDTPGLIASLSLESQEKRLIQEALRRTKGNQSEAARVLQISRDKLRYKMFKHGFDRKRRAATTNATKRSLTRNNRPANSQVAEEVGKP